MGEKRNIQVSINIRQRSSDLNEHVRGIVSGFCLTAFAKVIICAVAARYHFVKMLQVGEERVLYPHL